MTGYLNGKIELINEGKPEVFRIIGLTDSNPVSTLLVATYLFYQRTDFTGILPAFKRNIIEGYSSLQEFNTDLVKAWVTCSSLPDPLVSTLFIFPLNLSLLLPPEVIPQKTWQ